MNSFSEDKFSNILNSHQQLRGEKLLTDMALRIRQSLNLDHVLQTTVKEIQQFLRTQRVIIYKLEPDYSGIIVAESVNKGWKHILGRKINDHCFAKNWLEAYTNGRVQAISDIYNSNLSPCHIDILAELQVRANLVVPIVQCDNNTIGKKHLWGLLVAQECANSRNWKNLELELLQNLAIHIAIAIQQSQLYEQLNNQLIKQKQVEKELKIREKAQTILASLGQYALSSNDLNDLMEEAIKVVKKFFDVPYCGILELLPNGAALILSKGIGWNQKWIGKTIMSSDIHSQAGYILHRKKSVIFEDLRLETRFSGTPFLHNEGIISGMSSIIQGQESPFGILTIYTKKPCYFSEEDLNFLQTVANILASFIQRHQAKEELDRFFHLSLDLFCIASLDGYFTRINLSFCEVLGYSKTEILSRPFLDFVHPDDIDATKDEMEKLSHGIPSIKFENRYLKNDGNYCWLSWTAYPYEEKLLYCVARDITKNKEIAEKLYKSEQNFREIAENIREIFFIQDCNSRKLTYVSPAFEDIWGISCNTLYQNPSLWTEWIHPDDKKYIQKYFEESIIPQNSNMEYRIIRSDGEIRWLWCRTFVVNNNLGKVSKIVGIAEDITKRKLAETGLKTLNEQLEQRVEERTEALEDTTSRLMALMENLQMGVLVKDEKDKVILANQALIKMFNFLSDKEKINDFPEKYDDHFACVENFKQRYQEIISHNQIVIDEEYILKDGRIIEQNYVPINVNYKYAGNLWMYRDITPTKKVEIALRESESKFRTFIQTAGTVIIVLSPEYLILEWNEAAEKVSGYKREEVLGKNYLLLFLSLSDRKITIKIIKEVMKGEGIKRYESNIFAKDCSQKLMLWNLNALQNDNLEKIGVIACGHEITVTEKALKESEERFRGIFNQAAIGIVQLSIVGKFMAVNDRFLELIKYEENEIKKYNFQEIIHPDDISQTLTYLSNFLTQKNSNISIETRFLCQDKSIRWVNLTMSLVWENSQVPKYFIGVIQDLKDRFIAEEALWESEERFRAIFEQAAVGMSICNLDGGFFRVNQKFCEIVGYTHFELLKHTFYDLTEIKYREKNKQYVAELLQGKRENYTMEKCYICKDGTKLWVNVLVSLMRDHIHKPKYFIYVIENISDRKEAERLQKELMLRNNSIVEALGEIVYDHLLPEKKFQWNGHYEKVLGYSQAEIGNDEASWLALIHPEDIPSVMAEFKRAFAEDKIYDLEYRFKHKNGTYLWMYDRGIMHGESNNQAQYVVGVLRDITKRKQAQEKLKNNLTEKEVLLKEIHHRVKNNLYVISSLLNIQSTYVEDQNIIDFFQDSKNRIQTMAMIHEQLYQSHNLAQINFKEYLHRLVNNLLSSYNPNPELLKAIINVESLHLDLEIAIPCGLLINELVTNAFKHAFLPEVSGQLTINLYQDINQLINLIVADNGKGIPNDIDIKNTDSLGLRLVRILTEQLDGQLDFNTSSIGTSFHIKFKIYPD